MAWWLRYPMIFLDFLQHLAMPSMDASMPIVVTAYDWVRTSVWLAVLLVIVTQSFYMSSTTNSSLVLTRCDSQEAGTEMVDITDPAR